MGISRAARLTKCGKLERRKNNEKKEASQFKVISTHVYSTQAFWKSYLALPVCSRLMSAAGFQASGPACCDGRWMVVVVVDGRKKSSRILLKFFSDDAQVI